MVLELSDEENSSIVYIPANSHAHGLKTSVSHLLIHTHQFPVLIAKFVLFSILMHEKLHAQEAIVHVFHFSCHHSLVIVFCVDFIPSKSMEPNKS